MDFESLPWIEVLLSGLPAEKSAFTPGFSAGLDCRISDRFDGQGMDFCIRFSGNNIVLSRAETVFLKRDIRFLVCRDWPFYDITVILDIAAARSFLIRDLDIVICERYCFRGK
jgi:hypothetical protein